MKILIATILVTIGLTACDITAFNVSYSDYSYTQKLKNVDNTYTIELPNLQTEYDIFNYISSNVVYNWETGDHWQDPCYTLTSGKGDCEDFALLYISLVYKVLGKKYNLVLIDVYASSKAIVTGGKVNHAVVERDDGVVIDPQSYEVKTQEISYRYTYDEIFGNK